ncbi:hypothetical protein QTO30_02610 [Yoonia sp. GPGPB17]|uniref:hypothetical protein n=1 Tax=Yoonia sp. GPGPB17 TaxID=3026147 RepID=UPI0030BD205E
MRAFILAFLFVVGAVNAAHPRNDVELHPDAIEHILSDPDGRIARYIELLYQHSPTGVFYEELIEPEHDLAQSTRRALILARLLRFDLNGDYVVDEVELVTARDLFPHDTWLNIKIAFAAADKNRDWSLSEAEIKDHVEVELQRGPNISGRILMDFDADKNGEVHAREIVRTIRRVVEAEAQKCSLPPVPDHAELVLVTGSRAAALSNVTVVGEDDVTTAAELLVEEGDTPLYVIVSLTEPTVLNIIGATHRITNLIVNAQDRQTGVA